MHTTIKEGRGIVKISWTNIHVVCQKKNLDALYFSKTIIPSAETKNKKKQKLNFTSMLVFIRIY